MATPLKSITLSLVKTLSPRTPKLLAKSPVSKYVEHCSPQKNERYENGSSNISRVGPKKCLDYLTTSPINCKSNHLDVENVFTTPNQNKISKKNLLINTPVKKYLVKNGLSYKETSADILGKGSFGTVVKGLYKDTLVAVKIVKLKNNSTNLSDLNAKQLSHQNIVNIFEISMKPEDNYAVIIMEYIEGTRGLQTLLETNLELDGETKKNFIGCICCGMKYCHDQGILHLDIKPKNILVLENDQCKICDFGNSCTTKNTGNYVFQGTVAYAAPELLKGMIPTTKCDIYSLGITIWQIEYRENPYSEWLTNEALIYNVVKHHARPKHSNTNDMITQLFEKCWHKDAACRPEFSEILEMLERVI